MVTSEQKFFIDIIKPFLYADIPDVSDEKLVNLYFYSKFSKRLKREGLLAVKSCISPVKQDKKDVTHYGNYVIPNISTFKYEDYKIPARLTLKLNKQLKTPYFISNTMFACFDDQLSTAIKLLGNDASGYFSMLLNKKIK